MGACGESSLEMVQYLVLKGADVNLIQKDGNCALHIAAHHQHSGIVNFLLDRGANIATLSKVRSIHTHSWGLFI